MANDKYYGYSPKKDNRKPSTGVTDVGNRLDLSGLSSGLYNLSIIYEEKRYNKQIIKQ